MWIQLVTSIGRMLTSLAVFFGWVAICVALWRDHFPMNSVEGWILTGALWLSLAGGALWLAGKIMAALR